MSMVIFVAFIIAYALLAVAHSARHRKAYLMFMFGLLISILYASVYSIYNDTILVWMMALTTLAILTQYHHMRAVEQGRVKGTKMIIDVAKRNDLSRGKKEPHKYRIEV